jgi:hypothetical protein
MVPPAREALGTAAPQADAAALGCNLNLDLNLSRSSVPLQPLQPRAHHGDAPARKHPPAQASAAAPACKREPHSTSTATVYTDSQLSKALGLLATSSLNELGRQDFSVFGSKQSWIQLAEGCILRLAHDILLLVDIHATADRCRLLYRRLELRRAARARTPTEAQSAIRLLFSASASIKAVWALSRGEVVDDVEGALKGAKLIMLPWCGVADLAQAVTPKTQELREMVNSVLRTGLATARGAEAL